MGTTDARVPRITERSIVVWTADCSATVDLARMHGPRDGHILEDHAPAVDLPGNPPWPITDPLVRVHLYQHYLSHGTQYDIYRWVDLELLAEIWHLIDLPDGVHADWHRALNLAGLID